MIFAEKVLNFYCIGDSITNGARNEFYRDFVLELNYLFKNKKVIFFNDSVNGETTSEILKRVLNLISKRNIDNILFFGGTNDTRIPIPSKIFKKNIITLISVCKKKKIKLFLGTIPYIYSGLPSYSKTIGNQTIGEYNKIIFELSKKYNLVNIDFSKLGEKFFTDGVHLNNSGTEAIAKLIKNKINV